MNRLLLLLCLWGLAGVVVAQKRPLFDRIGLEVGHSFSHMVPSEQLNPQYEAFTGLRLGVFGMRHMGKEVYLKTGLFFTWRGFVDPNLGIVPLQLNQYISSSWSWMAVNLPLMIIYRLPPRVEVGAGMDINGLLYSNYYFGEGNGLHTGLRFTIGFYIVPAVRIGLYYTHVVNKFLENNTGPFPNATKHSYYNNVLVGFTASFTLYDWKKRILNKEFKHPCPRF